MHLDLADTLVDDPNFAPLFIQDGAALILMARLVCLPSENWRLEFDFERLEPVETYQTEPSLAADWHYSSGNSRHSQLADTLIVEAAVAGGPYRGSMCDPATLDHLRAGLTDLRERIIEELREAFACSEVLFEPDSFECDIARIPSAEVLLSKLCEAWQPPDVDAEITASSVIPAPIDGLTMVPRTRQRDEGLAKIVAAHQRKGTSMIDGEDQLELEEEIEWHEPQWEPTQTDPVDLWSGLPTDEWQYPVMTKRISRYCLFDEKSVVRSVVEALAVYFGDAGPKTRLFANQLLAAFGNKQPSQRARAIMTRIIVDRVLMPLSRWPESEAVDLLAGELGLSDVSMMRVRKLADAARRETGGAVLHGFLERSTPALALRYEVEHRDYDTSNDRLENLRGIYLAQAKVSVAHTADLTEVVSNPLEASDETATRH